MTPLQLAEWLLAIVGAFTLTAVVFLCGMLTERWNYDRKEEER